MNKKFIYYFVAVTTISALPFTVKTLLSKTPKNDAIRACPQDKKVCPDDSTVTRVLPSCEFAACKAQIVSTSSNLVNELATTSLATTTNTLLVSTSTVKKEVSNKNLTPVVNPNESQPKKVTIISKINAIVAAIISSAASPFKPSTTQSGNPNDATIPASTYITSSSSEQSTAVYKPLPPTDFAGQKYLVKDNNILSNDNKVIYTIPPEVITAVSSQNAGWTNTTINVVPVGTVAPIPPGNAIPITDLPGKYYLSENSFGNMEACEFSNKIFILDINTNTVTLIYEENGTTLSHDDPRACNSEIYLLATEASNLILKYHTIGTNTLCDSAWSEPDKTFYLDVTKLQTEGMKHYIIPDNLSATAEQEEEACRAKL